MINNYIYLAIYWSFISGGLDSKEMFFPKPLRHCQADRLPGWALLVPGARRPPDSQSRHAGRARLPGLAPARAWSGTEGRVGRLEASGQGRLHACA